MNHSSYAVPLEVRRTSREVHFQVLSLQNRAAGRTLMPAELMPAELMRRLRMPSSTLVTAEFS
jgi:hypothetical protein